MDIAIQWISSSHVESCSLKRRIFMRNGRSCVSMNKAGHKWDATNHVRYKAAEEILLAWRFIKHFNPCTLHMAGVSSSIVAARVQSFLTPQKKTTWRAARLSVPDLIIILKVFFFLFQTLECSPRTSNTASGHFSCPALQLGLSSFKLVLRMMV